MDKRTAQIEGFTVVISHEDDSDPDLSYLGKFKAKAPSYPYFDRALDRVVKGDEEWSDEDAERAENFSRCKYRYIAGGYGDPDYLEQDARRLLDYGQGWGCIGIRARVYLKGVELADCSVWGIESDSSDDYYEDIEQDQITEALAQAKAKLAELRE